MADRGSIDSEIIEVNKPRDRLRLFKTFSLGQTLNTMLNRVDNLLNSEQIWMEFRKEVLQGASRDDRGRYQRINPNLGFRPPRLDDKSKLPQVQYAAAHHLESSPLAHQKLARVALRLIASTFYFEKLTDTKRIDEDGGYELFGMTSPARYLPIIQAKLRRKNQM